MRFNFTTHSAANTTPAATATTTATARSNEKSAKPLNRPTTIEEDPDSLDSVISNPQSYPITIVPNRPASFYGLSSTNGKAFQRQPSCR